MHRQPHILSLKQQQGILRETVDEAIQGALIGQIREIYNNNPQVE